MADYLIPADVIAAAAEAMDAEAIRCLGRDLGTVHRDDIAAAALGAALAAGLLAALAPTDREVDDFVDELAAKLHHAYNGATSVTEPWRHVARIALAQRIPAVPHVNDVDRFADLTARLAAADAGWCLTYGHERADPAYIRWLARHIDAFEDHASPAAPADDAATVERVAVALWDTYTSRPANNVDHRYAAFWRVAACAALAALREGQQK